MRSKTFRSLKKNHGKLIDDAAYSTDWTTAGFFLFSKLKLILKRERWKSGNVFKAEIGDKTELHFFRRVAIILYILASSIKEVNYTELGDYLGGDNIDVDWF